MRLLAHDAAEDAPPSAHDQQQLRMPAVDRTDRSSGWGQTPGCGIVGIGRSEQRGSTLSDPYVPRAYAIGLGRRATVRTRKQPGMPIFISYSHADSDFVDRLATQLVSHAVNVWVDRCGDQRR